MTLRLDVETVDQIDQARGSRTRHGWIEDAIVSALAVGRGEQVIPAEVVKTAGRPAHRGTDTCPHPRARVIKGFCYACGWPAK